MYHYLTVKYLTFNPFGRNGAGNWELRTENFVLNWEGVKRILHDDFYRTSGFYSFKLAVYHGQKADN